MTANHRLRDVLGRYLLFSVGLLPTSCMASAVITLPILVLAALTGMLPYYLIALVASTFLSTQLLVRDQRLEYPTDSETLVDSQELSTSLFIMVLGLNMLLALSIVLASGAQLAGLSTTATVVLVAIYPLADWRLQTLRWWLAPSLLFPAAVLAVVDNMGELGNYRPPAVYADPSVAQWLQRRFS